MLSVPLRPPAGTVPDAPGVYRFRDASATVIYVGKARSLRARLSSYFADPRTMHPRTAAMVATANSVDWVTTSSEVEALHLEYTWIKEFDPRFNVRFRDDKSYPYLAVTLGEEFPRAMVIRGRKREGIRYFGPYAHAWAIRDTLDHLLRVFPVRSCSAGVFRRAVSSGRPCLLGDIGKCSAPCVGRVDAAAHRRIAEDFCAFMGGSTARYIKQLSREMSEASSALDYERAARLRDDIAALERVTEKSAVVLADHVDADVFGLAEDDLEAVVQVFHVRQGRIRGERALLVEKPTDASGAELLGDVLRRFYGGETDDIPREIICPALPEEADVVTDWLARLSGRTVRVRIAQRGERAVLVESAQRNADEALTVHKIRRTGDLTTRAAALEEIRVSLALAQPLLRIECIDISHLAGRDVIGSLVVFEDGLAKPRDYRTYALVGEEAGDDLASIASVVRRRFARLAAGEEEVAGDAESLGPGQQSGRRSAFSYPPSLLIVDGGPLQAGVAAREVAAAGAAVPVIGIAKRLEEVWPAGETHPVILPRGSEGLYLLQRIRDEAHRFALKAQRRKRSRSATASALDSIPGLGPARIRTLLKHFGSVKRIRSASPDDLAAVRGIGPGLAAQIHSALAAEAAPEA